MEPFSLVLVALAAIVLVLILKFKGSSSGLSKADGKLGDKLPARKSLQVDDSKPAVRILYGTQTGTAERFSKQLGNELRRKYGDSTSIEVIDIENYKAERRLPKERLVLFLMATYGDGEPTDNAADFYSWISSEAEAVENGEKEPFLEEVAYGVFGLGNKQYEHFNAVGKRMEKAMNTLGASAVVRRGDGDDDECIDDDFDKWSAELFAALEASSHLVGAASAAGVEAVPEVAPEYEVEILEGPVAKSAMAAPFRSGSGTSAASPFIATISEVRELHTAASDRSCVHVEIDISGAKGLSYATGDHVAIYAENSPEVVEEVAGLLGLPLDTVFKLAKPEDGSSSLAEPLPGPITLRDALAYFADVLSSPHKGNLVALAAAAADGEERAKLLRLAGPQGKAEYQEYVAKPHRSLLEVMREHPSAKPGLGLFFGSVAPRLQPRFYSISSSGTRHPTSVHVTCAVVRDVMPTGRVHAGVCSSWLAKAAVGTEVPVFIRHSHFRLPEDGHAPVIMVGPGTGLAPFRGFLQAELRGFEESGALGSLHVAFSREGSTKDYVQHHLAREGARVWELLRKPGACFYVCGDAKAMAKDVHRALIEVVSRHGAMSGTKAEMWVKEFTDSGRYMRDVW
ncbi:NADPH-cytochrome P450 reductase [Monoraphidium neglectum]|uniref:NADPH--hemoprotein reductase n=1 Tax=Monoraphidium neglectum TaxID=145388 RepID=A0A0D2NA21_9CHLO|nr:NADPH-cytochrome P450 reductase [Monoraphidium neglectum]KIZ02441.1 NADPH-cytochrome P450 reductase [Monoraphidium neglectum]|eukprot:XP_013901460.1 NADPH-cytochrome P450 reductase [Monoraphidium neglectum]